MTRGLHVRVAGGTLTPLLLLKPYSSFGGNPDLQSRTYTVSEAARILGISPSCAYASIRNDTFPVEIVRIGHRIVVPRRALDELVQVSETREGPGEEHPTARLIW